MKEIFEKAKKKLCKESELSVFLNLNKYIYASKNAKYEEEKNLYEQFVDLYFEELNRFEVDKNNSQEVFTWLTLWDRYLSNLSEEEYRYLKKCRMENSNLDKFRLENNPNTVICYMNENKSKNNEWLKKYLNERINAENNIEIKKIKEM